MACTKAIAVEDEESAAKARTELTAVLKEVFDTMRPYNREMLSRMATKLSQLAEDKG